MAYSVLSEVWEVFVANDVRSPLPGFGAPLARLASHTGHSARSAEVAAVLAGLTSDAGTVRARLVAEIAAAWRDGDADRAVRAAELAARTPLKPLTAATLTDAAFLLKIRGRAVDADRLANAATKRWSAMGADANAAICAAMSVTAQSTEPRSRFGVAALTRTERQVVRLVAEGKTNAEIANVLGVSRRTVESHVSATYRKLEVTTRVSMTRVALHHRI
jgi:DNA-binding CsgD family transcriptional regulator